MLTPLRHFIIVMHILRVAILYLLSCHAFAKPIVVLTEHLPPFQIVKQQQSSGAAVEMTKLIFQRAQIPYEMSVMAWSDAYHTALRSDEACLFSTSRLPQRESLFYWVGQLNSLNTSFYRSSSDAFEINSLEDVKARRVAVIKDDSAHHFLLSQGFEENVNLYVLHTYDSLLHLLDRRNRHIDLVLLNKELLEYRLKDSDTLSRYTEAFKVKELLLYHYLVCNLNTDSNTLEKLKQAYDELDASGQLSAIRAKWKLDEMVRWRDR